MTTHELAIILSSMYHNAPSGEKTTMIHLFGIKYAKEIRDNRHSVRDIILFSKLHESYLTEVQKGIKLAKYVKTYE